MLNIRRLLILIVLVSAATTGMVMGARWTGSGLESGAAIEMEKPSAQYSAVQAGIKDLENGSKNSRHWPLYAGVLSLTGFYIIARITGVKKRIKSNNLRLKA